MSPRKKSKRAARSSEAPSTNGTPRSRGRRSKARVVPIRTTSGPAPAAIAAAERPASAPAEVPTLLPPAEVAKPPTGADLPPDDVVQTLKNQMITNNEESPALRFGVPQMPFPRYPYAKGPDLANDGVGYGEVLRMTVYRANGSAVMSPATGYSRRTRSGRQVISKNELTPENEPFSQRASAPPTAK
jgi:hypothetical protein